MKKKKILVPNFSDDKTEAVVIRILNKDGSYVKKKELLIKIETEKVVIDIVSPCNGFFYKKKNVGEKVFPGKKIGYIFKKKNEEFNTKNIKKVIKKKNIKEKKIYNKTHYATTFNEIDVTKLLKLRNEILIYNRKVSLTAFFIKSSCIMLRKYPVLLYNTKKRIIEKNIDINVAISSTKKNSLNIPVLRECEKKSVYDISKEINVFKKKLLKDELSNNKGTFTISNGGFYGSLLSIPILNKNQSSIIGTHTIKKRVVILNKKIAIRDIMYVSMTYDHKYIKGKDAILSLLCFKESIERPLILL
ncbi:2-oxo acid dehydrogenase subunit E2 [Candidatus Vidania fulgoroideae]|nr:2-oxo acid dehydrogenase subunit E2 [Candidatus Vidania fulgoroideae]